jgi:hypothetical protein
VSAFGQGGGGGGGNKKPYAQPFQIAPGTVVDQDGNTIEMVYRPEDFICSPADSRGVSYRVTCRVMPDIEKGLDQMVASGKFPFQTRGDVMRWCFREGLRALGKMDPVTSVTKRIDLVSSILAEETAHAEFMHIFDAIEENVNKYMADQAHEQAVRVIALAKHNFEQMPEGHWRERYLKELQKRFGQLMQGKGVALKVGG